MKSLFEIIRNYFNYKISINSDNEYKVDDKTFELMELAANEMRKEILKYISENSIFGFLEISTERIKEDIELIEINKI